MSKGKQRATRTDGLDQENIFKIIDQTNVLNGQLPRNDSKAYKIVRPSELDALNASMQTKRSASSTTPSKKLVELIDGDEASLLNNESGQDDAEPGVDAQEEDDELEEEEDGPEISEFGEEMFRLFLYTVVFGTLWLCMDMMIHAQYGQDVTFKGELGRAMDVLPGLIFILYVTSHYPTNILTKISLFGFSAIGGSYMVYLVNKASYLRVMRRCPALGTLWLWAIVQLDLVNAVASLAAVFAFVKYKGLNIIFAS